MLPSNIFDDKYGKNKINEQPKFSKKYYIIILLYKYKLANDYQSRHNNYQYKLSYCLINIYTL